MDYRDKTLRNMQEIINFVGRYRREHLVSPTLAEIAVGIGMTEKDFGNVQPMVKKLVEEGFLFYAAKGGARTIVVSDPQPRPYYYRREIKEVTE
jgi:hypothetical protein